MNNLPKPHTRSLSQLIALGRPEQPKLDEWEEDELYLIFLRLRQDHDFWDKINEWLDFEA